MVAFFSLVSPPVTVARLVPSFSQSAPLCLPRKFSSILAPPRVFSAKSNKFSASRQTAFSVVASDTAATPIPITSTPRQRITVELEIPCGLWFDESNGVWYVGKVVEDGNAQAAGIKVGDVCVGVSATYIVDGEVVVKIIENDEEIFQDIMNAIASDERNEYFRLSFSNSKRTLIFERESS
eukprot:CAMPEP_0196663678 /NCGR_PEP_ID=MMETSP1086-20130531/53771_1 /TAXON_ID=77921 /ORGANISM="Cyanoptyche  gloeocystis , Strain SAG4.97" /LENGTH=180 /DNA_ID=CAMNT_0041999591 /DNA_START=44 /DNA_END=586 /DNA_ORIENTATION=-